MNGRLPLNVFKVLSKSQIYFYIEEQQILRWEEIYHSIYGTLRSARSGFVISYFQGLHPYVKFTYGAVGTHFQIYESLIQHEGRSLLACK